MVDQVKVVRPSVPVYSSTTGYAVGSTTATGYVGKAHVHVTQPQPTMTLGEGMTDMDIVTVTIPYDAAPVPRAEDHVVVISTGPLGDATLTGETFRILNVSGGGIGFVTRQLTCTLQKANPYDPGA